MSVITKGDWDALYASSGAVLLGGLVALFLSGAVVMQVFLYYRLYPSDPLRTKALVALVWLLDFVHSIMVCIANWQNLVANFGNFNHLDYITWSIAFTVALTASTTFFVHCFFSHRIHTLSRGNWYITGPLVVLALVRLVAATVSTTMMIRLKSFSGFVEKYAYVFTLGLSTSTGLDILITAILCYYLRRRRSGLARMDRIIDTLTLYTVENGMLTCLTTTASLICWIRMPGNLVFLGLHLAIGKLYANSFLASLNARRSLAQKSERSRSRSGAGAVDPLSVDLALPVIFPGPYSPRTPPAHGLAPWSSPRDAQARPAVRPGTPKPLQVQISVDVERTLDRDHDDYHDSDVPLSGASVGSDALTCAKEGSDFGGTRTI